MDERMEEGRMKQFGQNSSMLYGGKNVVYEDESEDEGAANGENL